MTNIIIFASGNGSNALKLIEHFNQHPSITVRAVFSNIADAPVLEKARKAGIDAIYFTRKEFQDPDFTKRLSDYQCDWIILAGFLWLVPEYLIQFMQGKIINLHPALLPSYGGKGMYGSNVHKAIIDAKEPFSGITIHLVDDHYDHGEILFQAHCIVDPDESPDSLASKIHQLEWKYLPLVCEKTIIEGVAFVRQMDDNKAFQ
jgi:phosphoribosylglycinamide formyltransferase-1